MKSFHEAKNDRTIIVTVIGFNRGNTILKNTWYLLQPSILAASSKVNGTVFIKPEYKKNEKSHKNS